MGHYFDGNPFGDIVRQMIWKDLISAFLAFFALVNPLQKLFVVISLRENYSHEELNKIINRSNRTALEVLVIFLFAGEIVLIM